MKTIVSLIIIVWSTLFLEKWKRRENSFAVNCGTYSIYFSFKKKDGRKNKTIRPSYEGQFYRSFENDTLNIEDFSDLKRKFLML